MLKIKVNTKSLITTYSSILKISLDHIRKSFCILLKCWKKETPNSSAFSEVTVSVLTQCFSQISYTTDILTEFLFNVTGWIVIVRIWIQFKCILQSLMDKVLYSIISIRKGFHWKPIGCCSQRIGFPPNSIPLCHLWLPRTPFSWTLWNRASWGIKFF